MARILLIDDDPENRTLLALFLETGGHTVELTSSGEAGIAAIRARRPDLVLLDAMLPDTDGYQVCRRLRAESGLAGLPILFISARMDARSYAQALEAGATGYLSKSLARKELLSRVAEALA